MCNESYKKKALFSINLILSRMPGFENKNIAEASVFDFSLY